MNGKAPDFPIAPILEDLGAQNVPYVHGGGYRRLICPFHADSSPSASVSEFGFRCHTCGVAGDAIKLLREQGGLSYQDAVRRAADLTGGTGVSVPREPDGWWGGSTLLE